MLPPTVGLIVQVATFFLAQVGNVIDSAGVLGGQSTFLEQGQLVLHVVFGRKVFDILEKLFFGDPGERVFDSCEC